MPHIFVDDGAPEAEDYASNYIWFDSDDRGSYVRALAEARRRFAARWAIGEVSNEDGREPHASRELQR